MADALAKFEAEPEAARWRRRRYQTPPVFGFTIDALTDIFLVLWRKELAGSHPDAIEDSIIVEYFGLDL